MTTDRRRVKVVAGSVVFVVLGTLLQLPRQSGVHMWRTVWAEDGPQFAAAAMAHPWRTNVLASYAGYAHVVPRTLASIGVQLPTEWYSIFVTITAAASASLLALFVYFASAGLLRSPVRQAILALALLFWPVLPFEITGSITNIQWAMPVACLLAVLLPVQRRWAIAVRLPVVVLAPLSSPICVLFVPIAVWHLVRDIRRRAPRSRLVVPAVYCAAAAMQLAVYAFAPQYPGPKPPLGEFASEIARLFGTKVAAELFLGVRSSERVWDVLGYGMAWIAVVVLAGVLVWRFVRASTTARWFILGCVVAGVGIFVVSVWQRSVTIGDMLLDANEPYNFAGMRYQLFPAALFLLALLVPLDLETAVFTEPYTPTPPPIRDELRTQRFALGVALVWLLVAFVPSYRLTTARSPGPDWITGVRAAEQTCRSDPDPAAASLVPISPQPIWFFAVPCWDIENGG